MALGTLRRGNPGHKILGRGEPSDAADSRLNRAVWIIPWSRTADRRRSANHMKGAIALGNPEDYPHLVRRYWRRFLGGIALCAIIGPLLFIFGQHQYPVISGVLGMVLGLGLLLCWGSAVAAWFAILRFRCPRCSKRFALSSLSSWPTSTCKHCGLFLG